LSIRHLFEAINAEYRINPDQGRFAEAVQDYYVDHGVWSITQCKDLWSKIDGEQTRWQYVPIEQTITKTPLWRDPVVGRPEGQVYALTLHITGSGPDHPPTGNKVVHVTTLPSGGTYMFKQCAISKSA
jgi:hypothetical protein